MKRCLLLFALVLPTVLPAQGTAVRGVVTARGVPISGVNVFDLNTLAGGVTRDDGRFSFRVDSTRSSVHLITRAIGFAPVDTTIARAGFDSVLLILRPLTILLPISVQAGRYTANASPTTTLTAREVATIPGANADISGAVKTFPGVQSVDEGTGIFVRGGDFTETRIFVDGAPLFTAYQFEAPTGSVAGSINPFLTSSIAFSSGGFGAEWGNALSGIVDLRTQGRSTRSFSNINASILGLSLSGGLALPHNVGVAATAGATDLTAMLDMNGNPRGYTPAPHGQIASALAAWDYGKDAGIKIFSLYQKNGFGIPVVDPVSPYTFANNRSSDITVLSWRDSAGLWRPFASASTSGFSSHDETKGAFEQRTGLRSMQLRLESPFVVNDRVTLTVGGEAERLSSNFSGTFPANKYNNAAGAPSTSSALDTSGIRLAEFASIDTRPTASSEFVAGLRTTTSPFAAGRSYDPRLSFAWIPFIPLTITAAWGRYHQIADPAFLERLATTTTLPGLGSRLAILGAQLGQGTKQARVEVWSKHYDNLVGLTRSYATAAHLAGHAQGTDFLVRGPLPGGVDGRVSYSISSSHRTDPNTGVDAPAPFDVTNSVIIVAQKSWLGWSAGIAGRYATGHPFTDVTNATLDPAAGVYVPTYGTPNALRIPDFNRTDITISRQRPFGGDRYGVAYIGINNIFNQVNTFGYTWSHDYSQRLVVRSAVNRTVFIGANLVLLQ